MNTALDDVSVPEARQECLPGEEIDAVSTRSDWVIGHEEQALGDALLHGPSQALGIT